MNSLRHTLPIIFSVCLMMASCMKEETPRLHDPQESSPFIEGKMVVRFSEDVARMVEEDLPGGLSTSRSAAIKQALDDRGVVSIERLFKDAGEFEARHRAYGLHTFYTLSFDEVATKSSVPADFSSIPGVVTVDKPRKKEMSSFNDPFYVRQWYCYNDGSLSSSFKAGADINVEPVWEYFTTGSRDVIVGIVDGGIDYTHPDITANYMGGSNFCPFGHPVTPHRHGTHVAGIIGAVSNNGIGMSGIAGGDKANEKPGVRLLSCQIFEPDPIDPKKDIVGSEAEAILYACNCGAVIAQNSWGYKYDKDTHTSPPLPEYLKYAIDYFIANAGYEGFGASRVQKGPMAGGVIFFAAGNDNCEVNSICEYKPVPETAAPGEEVFSPLVAVGAIDSRFSKANYSNYGDWVDICAPGGTDAITYGEIYSCVPGGKYEYMCGTSMACPMVSGVAALIVSHFGGEGFTNQDLLRRLYKGANYEATRNQDVGPLVDAFGSFTIGDTTPPEKVNGLSVEVVANNILVTFPVSADEGSFRADRYKVVVGLAPEILTDALDFDALPTGVKGVEVKAGRKTVGEELTAIVGDLEFNKTYYVAVVGFDYQGNCSEISGSVPATTVSGKNPVNIVPNPVSDEFYIITDYEETCEVEVLSATGSVIEGRCEIKTGPFKTSDNRIYCYNWAVGRYTVKVTYKGISYTKNIVKI